VLTCTRPALVMLALVDRELATGRGLRISEFAVRYEVSRRTVQRYLDLIRDRFGLAIRYNAITYRWHYPERGRRVFSRWVHEQVL
jgi:predicted DNA-binding transcriptional regulator YafY